MAPRVFTTIIFLAALALFAPTNAAPTLAIMARRNDTTSASGFQKQNGLDAQKLNAQFATLKESDSCQDGEVACISSSFAQCVSGNWTLTPCATGTSCVALPLVNKAGTSVACDSGKDASSRFAAAGVQGGVTGDGQVADNSNNATTGTGTGDGDLKYNDGSQDGLTGGAASVSSTATVESTSTAKPKDKAKDKGMGKGKMGKGKEKFTSTSSSAATASDPPSIIDLDTATGSASGSYPAAGTTIFLNSPVITSAPAAATETSVEADAQPATTIKLNKRQLAVPPSSTVAVSSPAIPAIPVIPAIATGSSAVATTATVSGVSSASFPNTGVASQPVGTIPTSVVSPIPVSGSAQVGSSNIPAASAASTVTVTSTLTVTTTIVVASTPALPTNASSALPTAADSGHLTSVSVSSSASNVATAVSSPSSAPAASVIPLTTAANQGAVSSSSSATPSTPTTSATAFGGFSFSSQPTTTAIPNNNVNIGNTADIASLLTATI